MATTQELLKHLSTNILRDRPSTITGGVNVPLWPDETLIRYLNSAERFFARRTWCIKDNSTPAITQLSLTAVLGASYTLHKSVLKVLSARLSTEQTDLVRLTHGEMHPRTDYNPYPWPSSSSIVTPGKPFYYSTDEATRKIEFLPAPDGNYTVLLRVARLPSADLSLSALAATPEIPEEYHLDLCEWAAYLALKERDVDGNAKEMAAEHKGNFMAAVVMARQDVHRAEATPLKFHFGGW